MNGLFRSRGFALPVVLISSVVMMTILLISLTSISSISTALTGQHYTKLASMAAESGLVMAHQCMASNKGVPAWTSSSLRPNTTCSGGTGCTNLDQCFVVNGAKIRTTFSVDPPTQYADESYRIVATAVVQGLRSDGSTVTLQTVQSARNIKAGWTRLTQGGGWNTCGIGLEYKAYCWGFGFDGVLGNGGNANSNVPVPVSQGAVPAGVLYKDIDAGGLSYICGLATNDRVYCWGDNMYGQLGTGNNTNRNVPTAVTNGAIPGGTVKTISAGGVHTCVVGTNDRPYCWGHNNDGQLGRGNTTDSSSPVAVSSGAIPSGVVKLITTGTSHTCATDTSDRVYCWGRNVYGQLGNGNNTNASTPVSTTAIVKALTAGESHTCAIGTDDRPYCWGENTYGQLGTGNNTNRNVAYQVSAGAIPNGTVKAISAGASHTCAIGMNDRLYCWGSGGSGELGRGSTSASNVPVAVSNGAIPGGLVKVLAAGSGHNCAVGMNDRLYCWGENGAGQLGDGTSTNRSTPVLAEPSYNVGVMY